MRMRSRSEVKTYRKCHLASLEDSSPLTAQPELPLKSTNGKNHRNFPSDEARLPVQVKLDLTTKDESVWQWEKEKSQKESI